MKINELFVLVTLMLCISLCQCKERPTDNDDQDSTECCQPPSGISLIEPVEENNKPASQYEGAVFIGPRQDLIDAGIDTNLIVSCDCNQDIHLINTSDFASVRNKFMGLLNPEVCKPNGTCGGDGHGNSSPIDSKDDAFYQTNGTFLTHNIIGTFPRLDDRNVEVQKGMIAFPPDDQVQNIRVAVLDGGLPSEDLGLTDPSFQYPNTNCDLDLVDETRISPYIMNSGSSLPYYYHGEIVKRVLMESLDRYAIDDKIEVIPIRVADDNGQFTLFSLLCGLYTAKEESAQFVNLSLSMLTKNDYSINVLRYHMNKLSKEGMVFIAANGNDGSNLDCFGVYPAEYNFVYGVSALTCDKSGTQLADYSNYSTNISQYGEMGTDVFAGAMAPFTDIKGTSFATPKFTAAIISHYIKEGWIGSGVMPLVDISKLPKTNQTKRECGNSEIHFFDVENKCN